MVVVIYLCSGCLILSSIRKSGTKGMVSALGNQEEKMALLCSVVARRGYHSFLTSLFCLAESEPRLSGQRETRRSRTMANVTLILEPY